MPATNGASEPKLVTLGHAPPLQHGRSGKHRLFWETAFYSPPYGDGGMLCMIAPRFLAPDGASSPGAIAIGLLAETFLVLIINSLGLLA